MSDSKQQAMQIEEMAFVRATAKRLGVEVQSLARAYENLRACTKGTYMEGQSTRELFAAAACAVSAGDDPAQVVTEDDHRRASLLLISNVEDSIRAVEIVAPVLRAMKKVAARHDMTVNMVAMYLYDVTRAISEGVERE